MSQCSVIMASYHTGLSLIAAVKSVLRQDGLTELIVMNNGNPPHVMARLQQLSLRDERLRVQTPGENIGLARALNLGVQQSRAEYMVFLSADCLLPPDALKKLVKSFGDIPDSMIAGAWVQKPDGREISEARTRLPQLAHAWGVTSNQYGDMPRDTHSVEAVSSLCMCISRADFESLGGFDEDYFLYVEDKDLCKRAADAGGRVICVPSVKVTRLIADERAPRSRSASWQRARSQMLYFRKYMALGWLGKLKVYAACPAICMAFVYRQLRHFIRRRLKPGAQRQFNDLAQKVMLLANGFAELPETGELRGKAVLVTGATGQLGLSVIKYLLASGAAVLAVSRSDALPFRHDHLRWIKGDLTDETFHLHGYLLDIAVHCAPLWHLPATIDVLADAEVQHIVAFSSTSIFGNALSKNAHEYDIVGKLTHAESEIERRCTQRSLAYTLLRPTLVYGAGLDETITSLAHFIRTWRFMPLYPPAFGKRQPVHVDDLAQSVIRIVQSPASRNKTYNASGGEVLTYEEMVGRIAKVCGCASRVVHTTLLPGLLDIAGKLMNKPSINGEIARRMNDDLVFFHDDAVRDFGYSPRPFLSRGLRDIEGI